MKELFITQALDKFNEVMFGNCYYGHDIISDEVVITQKVLTGIEEDKGQEKNIYERLNHQGYVIKDNKNKKLYFLKSEYINDMPIRVRETQEVVYKNKVYNLIKSLDKVGMKQDNTMTNEEFYNAWFPFPHTNPIHLDILKICTLSAMLERCYFRIITNKGFGKTGVIASMLSLTGDGIKIDKDTSHAKLSTSLDHDFVHFDETGGLSTEFSRILGNLFFGTADGTSNIYQHNTTGSNITKSRYDITKFGYCITHNPPESYLEKGQEPFEQQFRIEVFDRIPCFELSGMLDTDSMIVKERDWFEFIKENKDFYRKFVGKYLWLKDNAMFFSNEDFDYNFKYPNASNRHNNWMRVFAKYTKLFCPDRYKMIMDEVQKCYNDYIKKCIELGLINEEQ